MPTSRFKRRTASIPIWATMHGGNPGEKTQGLHFEPGDANGRYLSASIAIAVASGQPWDLTIFKVPKKKGGPLAGRNKVTVTVTGGLPNPQLGRWIHSRSD